MFVFQLGVTVVDGVACVVLRAAAHPSRPAFIQSMIELQNLSR